MNLNHGSALTCLHDAHAASSQRAVADATGVFSRGARWVPIGGRSCPLGGEAVLAAGGTATAGPLQLADEKRQKLS